MLLPDLDSSENISLHDVEAKTRLMRRYQKRDAMDILFFYLPDNGQVTKGLGNLALGLLLCFVTNGV